MLESDPDFAYIHSNLGWAYYLDARVDEAVGELKQAVATSGGDPVLKADLACVLGFSGHRDDANKILEELKEVSKAKYFSKMRMAQVLSATGKMDEAFRRLDEALEDHSVFTQHGGHLLDMRVFPCFAEVREDPRWDAFAKQLGIPEV